MEKCEGVLGHFQCLDRRAIVGQGRALCFQQVTGAMGRCECAWSLSVPGRFIVRLGFALCFQQVTVAMGRCECSWSLSVPGRVIVGQGPALCFQQVAGRWGMFLVTFSARACYSCARPCSVLPAGDGGDREVWMCLVSVSACLGVL